MITLFCSSHVIVTCRSVTLALFGVGKADAWNAVRARFRIRVRVCCHMCCCRILKEPIINNRFLNIKTIDINKSRGPDGISGAVLKYCTPSLANPLSMLFNISYSSGQSDWKQANVVPVHRKGDKSDIENCRPISLTSLVMKIMEIIIQDEIYAHCKDLISDKQYGFLPSRSCTTQLIHAIDDISTSLNSLHDVDIVYFDFAKAFDSVSHDKILEKLKYKFKVDSLMLKFVKGYLENKTQ